MALILTVGATGLLLVGALRALALSPFPRGVQWVLALVVTGCAFESVHQRMLALCALLQHRPAQWVLGSCVVLVLVVLGAVRSRRRRGALRAVLGELPTSRAVNVGELERQANSLGGRFAACRALVDTYERHGSSWRSRGSQFLRARQRTMALLRHVHGQTRRLLRTRDDPAVLDASLLSSRCLGACRRCVKVNRHASAGAFTCGAQALWDAQGGKAAPAQRLLPERDFTLYLGEDGQIVRG